MDDEQAKKVSCFFIWFLCALLAVGWLLQCTGCGSTKHDSDSIRTVDELKKENQSARSEIEHSERHLEHAEADLNRATDAVVRSEEAAIRSPRSID